MSAPKDAELRAVALRRFYDERHIRSWIGLPIDPSASMQEKIVMANICEQLSESRMIEWKTPARGIPEGMGRITSLGVDVIEGNARSPIAISIDKRITIHGSSHIQIGEGNAQDIHFDAERLVASINGSSASVEEKEEAKGLLRAFLENPLIAKLLGFVIPSAGS